MEERLSRVISAHGLITGAPRSTVRYPGQLLRAYRLVAARLVAGAWTFAAQVLVLATSPSSYRACQRRLMLHGIYRATWPMLPGFTLLTAIFAWC